MFNCASHRSCLILSLFLPTKFLWSMMHTLAFPLKTSWELNFSYSLLPSSFSDPLSHSRLLYCWFLVSWSLLCLVQILLQLAFQRCGSPWRIKSLLDWSPSTSFGQNLMIVRDYPHVSFSERRFQLLLFLYLQFLRVSSPAGVLPQDFSWFAYRFEDLYFLNWYWFSCLPLFFKVYWERVSWWFIEIFFALFKDPFSPFLFSLFVECVSLWRPFKGSLLG